MHTFSSSPLSRLLLKPLADNQWTRLYQRELDRRVDRLKKEMAPRNGLLGARDVLLPHEEQENFWELSADEQKALCSPAALAVYQANAGRAGTAPLCELAFCWHSSLSRHFGDPELLALFQAGLERFCRSIRQDGVMGSFGLNGESWAHGWDVEGLIYGLMLTERALPADWLHNQIQALHRAGRRLLTLRQTPHVIGSYGNQRLVYALGLYLHGILADDDELVAAGDRVFRDALPKVLDASGQVIEQQGPCMHYSSTAFIYAWLNLVVRGDTTEQDRVLTALRWFRERYTASLYPIAGPSTRKYYETLSTNLGDLLPATEDLALTDPMPREWLFKIAARLGGTAADAAPPSPFPLAGAHAASILMWSILLSKRQSGASADERAVWNQPQVVMYDHTQLLKRFPLKYILARQRYQTHFTLRDFLPFSGIQTWAWGNEPPIIHPTPARPSTTRGWGLDTARQGASHNWGGYGAGAVGVDGYLRPIKKEGELPLAVARYDWFWRVVVFTEYATVLLEFGAKPGPREMFWTLNRVEPATPRVESGKVTFTERVGTLHTTLTTIPEIRREPGDQEQLKNVVQLYYQIDSEPIGFAFSTANFQFLPLNLAQNHAFSFRDEGGECEVILDDRFFLDDNPGNFSVDTWRLAHSSVARRL